MVTEKIVEGYKVINSTPDMTEDERKEAESEAVKQILREYNRLNNSEKVAINQK